MATIRHTIDYDKFIFRPENRLKINDNHVMHLVTNIRQKNMLHLHPIIVDKEFNIIDGQHRAKAARIVGVPIYYIVAEDESIHDVVALNVQQPWCANDYLNYYVQTGNKNYIEFQRFLKKYEISVSVGLRMTAGRSESITRAFRDGKLIFAEQEQETRYDNAREIVEAIKAALGNGSAQWANSSRFWLACLMIVDHPQFDLKKLLFNIPKMQERLQIKTSSEGYRATLKQIHNWHNHNKIED